MVIGLLSVVFFFWARSLWNKLKRSFRKGNPNKKKLLISSEKWAAGELVEDLSKMTPPINRPGKDRVTVKGISSRIFLIIMAKAGGAGPDLSEDQSEAILDYVLSGLGEVSSRDYPRVRVWEPQYSPEGFTQIFNQNVRVPEPKGTKSNWILANGAVKMGRDKIYLGIAFLQMSQTLSEVLRLRMSNGLMYYALKRLFKINQRFLLHHQAGYASCKTIQRCRK